MKVSIIINNYNYGRFLRCAIDSALNQSYKNCEIIVVDDGSQDNSEEIIASYGGNIISVYKENGGQMSCYQSGLQASGGEAILFLDADDYLHFECIDRCMQIWGSSTVKVQFYLDVVDEHGISLGGRVPSGSMDSKHARRMMDRYSSYSSPPGSGNIFSTSFIRKIFPVKNIDELTHNADAVPIYAAPYYGEILSLHESVGYYRRHATSNTSIMSNLDLSKIMVLLKNEYESDLNRDKSWRRVVPGEILKTDLYLYNPSQAKRSVCYYRFNKWKGFDGEEHKSSLRVLCKSIKSLIFWEGYSPTQKIAAFIWFSLVVFLPLRVAIVLMRPALVQGERTGMLKWFLRRR